MAQNAESAQAVEKAQALKNYNPPSANPLIPKETAEKEKKEKNERAIWWTFILYKESAPENWQQILNDLGLIYAASPWHDRDIYDSGEHKGEIKKPHRHIVIKFAGRRYFQQVKELTDLLNQPIPQKCQNYVGAIQYFLHLNDPEKAQYDLKDCIDHGIGIEKIIAMAGDKDKIHYENSKAVRELVRENNFLDFNDVFDYCVGNGYDDLGKWISKNHALVERFTRGTYNKIERKEKKTERERNVNFQISVINLCDMLKVEFRDMLGGMKM